MGGAGGDGAETYGSALIGVCEGATIKALAARWTGQGLWDDVAVLAGRFWASREGSDRGLGWHHLVLAVGNFKRQGGRRLRPVSLGECDLEVASPRRSLVVPGTVPAVGVSVDEASSWPMLQDALPGAGLPTTTTLLAALWPDRHLIFDWRVHAVVNGLLVSVGHDTTNGVGPDTSVSPPATWSDYRQVRRHLLGLSAAAEVSLAAVERAFYELSRQVRSEPGRTWRGYGAALVEAIAG